MASVSRVRGEATSKSFVYMWIGARHMLRLAKDSQDGQLYTCLSCMVLTAFMLEAYFNHLGQLQDADWEKVEQGYSKMKKFTRFAEAGGLNPKMDERPYASLTRLFVFRDSMAHSRTMKEEIDVEIELGDSIAQSLPTPEWQQMITVENAEDLLSDAVAIIRDLHKVSGYSDNPFASGGGGVYVASKGAG